jgi:hypothetical protein
MGRMPVHVLQACSQAIASELRGRERPVERGRSLQAGVRLEIENSPKHKWDCSAIFRFVAVGLPTTFAHSRQVDRMIPLQMVLRTKCGTLGGGFKRLLRGQPGLTERSLAV